MRWRVLMAVALLCAVVAGGLYFRGQTIACCDEVIDLLQPTAAELESGVLPDSDALEKALEQWEHHLPLLSFLLHQDRLERVGQCLSSGLGYLDGGDSAGSLAQIHTAMYLLRDIREYDDILWQVLF